MPATGFQFDRDSVARWYAGEHLRTDPGIVAVYYLPTNAGEREIRFIEINQLLSNRNEAALEPIDFGVDFGTENEHKLFVLDVTPEQWEQLKQGRMHLPPNWSLADAVDFHS